MATIQDSMKKICQIFGNNASKDSDASTLNKHEFKSLIEKEFPDLYQKTQEIPDGINLFEALDANKDDLMDFPEFMALLMSILMMNHFFDDLQQPAQPVATLEDYMKNINRIFRNYASKDRNASLNMGEFKSLMQNECPDLYQKVEMTPGVMKMFKASDKNEDNVLHFPEFLVILSNAMKKMQRKAQ